jgi:hypothetical protein
MKEEGEQKHASFIPDMSQAMLVMEATDALKPFVAKLEPGAPVTFGRHTFE